MQQLFLGINQISTKRAPSSGGHTQLAELILCTSSFKRTTFKKPDAARLSKKIITLFSPIVQNGKKKGETIEGKKWRRYKKENKQPERGAH